MADRSLPIIAIVGRPNVGKSTLFNRFAGSRRALVENTPGVTRDRITETVDLGHRKILLVDTAGLDPEAEAGLEAAVQAQAREAVEGADAVMFVVDGKGGLLPEDEEIARTLRKGSRPLLLVVNKIDQPKHEARAAEFHRLGLPLRTVSAEHGTGASDALEALVAEVPESGAPEEILEGVIRIALVGRPNVGKSSLTNRLLGDERVVVSDVPGTTRDAVDSLLRTEDGDFVLIDTAGLRRPGRREKGTERASAYMALRALERADVALVVIDANEGVTDQDVRVAGMARERGRAAALLANKWDLAAKEDAPQRRRTVEEIQRRLRFMSDTPVLQVSAKTGARCGKILPLVRQLAAAAHTRIETSALNEWLKDATNKHEPAMAQRGSRRRPVKFLYATQTAEAPPTFVLFCSAPESIQKSYVRFLENQLRERFGLQGTPVRLLLRHRRGEGRR